MYLKTWIPAPRLRGDKLRGNDKNGIIQRFPNKRLLTTFETTG